MKNLEKKLCDTFGALGLWYSVILELALDNPAIY